MKTLFLKFILLVFLFSNSLILAQDNPNKSQIKNLKVDLDKKTISSPFPYDEYFKMTISSKKNDLNLDAIVLRVAFVKGKDGIIKVPYKKRSSYRKGKSNAGLDEKEKIDFDIRKLNDSTFEATIPPKLKPNQMYEIVFKKKMNNQQLNTFYKIFQHTKKGEDSIARSIFDREIAPLDIEKNREVPILNMVNIESINGKKVKITPFDYYLKYLKGDISNKIASLPPLIHHPTSIDKDKVENISKKLVEKKMSIELFARVMFEFIDINTNDINKIYNGTKSFSSDNQCEEYELQKRLKNLKNNLTLVNQLEKEFKVLLVHYANDSGVKSFYENNIISLQSSLKNNYEKLKVTTSEISEIINKYYSYGEIITNSTYTIADKNNGLTYLTSDFGFINSWGTDPFGQAEYIGRPYFGLNWHIGGYNKNKKISQVANKRIWYRLSIAIGVTLGEIDEGGYKDLFSNLSPSLGINYRLTQDVRLGVGGLLVKENRNPIVNNENVAVLPYISISFDYSLLKDIIIATRIFN